eukprot:CAMPEP_0197198236 /NCGR_PEP_ID=MMETSP1423-20130617/33269_1 /TAXON_ID=476441 /ORGANISM="Pseudo-nitzschia heimii, Strain UNC1101" /LENGTH=357 /DNA_ID=CAMNT_0042652067 /DNA_START=80 /DNA_END=1152 /DNA_ORIENTATION=+
MSVSNILAGSPPLANYGILTGQMFLYARGRAAFESLPPKPTATTTTEPSLPCERKCILLGGLSDGLLPVPYTSLLEEACRERSWSLVQPVLSSSYLGFGSGSLDRDVAELDELIGYLKEHRNGRSFAIVGHSTGCQDAVHFLKRSNRVDLVEVVALQAPVSDREGSELEHGFAGKLEVARNLVGEGKGEEMLPRSFHWAPITARRFVDLHAKGGTDDYFSSDYTDAELEDRLGHVGNVPASSSSLSSSSRRKVLVAFSGADQYVPEHVDKPPAHPSSRRKVLVAFSGADQYVPEHVDKPRLTQRLVDAMNSGSDDDVAVVAESLYIDNGDHNLSTESDAKVFVDRVAELLEKAASGK